LDFFLAKYVRELGKSPMHFSPRALKTLTEYAWPGNVRELQNLVHRLVIMADDNTIDTPDLPENFRFSATRNRGLNRRLEEVEREYILEVLSANKNNISHAAQVLGIDRKTLREKIKRKKD
jgi:DNA-binding NtrC family response regulator